MEERLRELLKFIEWYEQQARERLCALPPPAPSAPIDLSEMIRTIREPIIREITTAMSIESKLLELFPELKK